MRPIKAIGQWYVHWMTPYSIAIRPFLRKASLFTSLLLDAVSFMWLIQALCPLGTPIVYVLNYAFFALLIFSLLLFFLYMITMQFNLDTPSSKHWSKVIPIIVFIALVAGNCYIVIRYGRPSPEWDVFFDTTIPVFIGWLLSAGLSAIYSQLLAYHRNCNSHHNSN